MLFVVIGHSVDVDDSMYETENDAIGPMLEVGVVGSPVDYYFEGHVIVIIHDL